MKKQLSGPEMGFVVKHSADIQMEGKVLHLGYTK